MLDGYTTVNNLNDPAIAFMRLTHWLPTADLSASRLRSKQVHWLSHRHRMVGYKYHHPRIARAILMIDIANETRSVAGNMTVNHIANVTGTKLSK